LSGQLGLAEFTSSLQDSRNELSAHREDISSMLSDVPDFLVAAERDAWLEIFSKIDLRLSKVEDKVRDREMLEDLARDLPQLMDELTQHSLSLRECAWAARGPTSHGGVNELLYLMERFVDSSTEEMLNLLHAKLEVEFVRFEHQASVYQDLPEFAALAMEELLPEFREILEAVARLEELETEEELEQLFARLEDWGMNYSAYDIDFIGKRYSQVPTPIPSVNLALNSQLLYLDELVTEGMVEYAVGLALDVLQSGSETFLEEQTLSDVDAHAYDEILTKLMEGLETVPEIEDKDQLKERGGELVKLVDQFVSAQSRAETESGSRLDFKSE
jgi:hypothetical protein